MIAVAEQPHSQATDPDAERVLLGAILRDGESYRLVEAAVPVENFALESHKRIYRAMGDLYTSGAVVEAYSVALRLKDQGLLESVGGLSYISSLDDGFGVVMGVDTYIQSVNEKAEWRAAYDGIGRIYHQLQEERSPAAALEQAATVLTALNAKGRKDRTLRSAGDIINDYGGLDAFLTATEASVPLPWPQLNTVLGGGLREKELIIIGARPSVGKTAMALQIASHAALLGLPPVLFSLEMPVQQLIHRMACGMAGVDSNAFRMNKLEFLDQKRVRQAVVEIAEMGILFDDSTSKTVPSIHAAVRRLQARQPVGLVVIDYLQLMESPGRHGNRQEAVSTISRGLKQAAMELGVPFVVLSQLSRGSEERDEPKLRDLRESGSIEQDADIVLFPHRTGDQYGSISAYKMILAKQRNGPIASVDMNFQKQYGRFEEAAA